MALARFYPSGTNGDAATAANTGGTSWFATGGTGTITTDAPLLGSHTGCRMAATSTSGVLHTQRAISATALGFDVYFTLEVGPSGEVSQVWCGTGAARGFAINITSARKIVVRDSANTAIWTSTAVLAVSATTIVRLAGYVTQSATTGTVLLSIYTGTDPEALTQVDTSDTLTGRNTGASAYDTIRIGAKAASGTQTITTKLAGFGLDQAATGLPAAWTAASENNPPVVGLTASKSTLFPGETATLTATATDDGTIATTSWSTTAGTLTGTGLERTLTAPASLTDQTATITFTATDNLGASNSTTATVTLKASAWRLCGSPGTPLIERLT